METQNEEKENISNISLENEIENEENVSNISLENENQENYEEKLFTETHQIFYHQKHINMQG